MIINISAEEYAEMSKSFSSYNFFNSSQMGLAREFSYEEVKFIGLIKDDVVIATSHLLIESLPKLNFKVASCIKGINIDYENKEHLKLFNIELKKYLKKEKIVYFRFDPNVIYGLADGNYDNFKVVCNVRDNLLTCGYKRFYIDEHYFGRSPQVSMLVDIEDYKFKDNYNRSVKRGIKQAIDYGCVVKKSDKSLADIKKFYELHSLNAKLSEISVMPLEYYLDFIEKNFNGVNLYFVEVKKQQLLLKLEGRDKFKQLVDELKNKDETITVIGHLVGFDKKTSYDLFTGMDYLFNFLGAKELLMDGIFSDLAKGDVKAFDFWGIPEKAIDNDKMSNVYTFKQKFSNKIVYYPGYYDVVANGFKYRLAVVAMKYKHKK